MEYDNSMVRRQNRLMEKTDAYRLLKEGEFGVLSMVTPTGKGYGVPFSYVWDGGESVYFHCAPEGEKLKCFEVNEYVSFCVVGKTEVIPDKFTTNYESIIVSGTITTDLSTEERMHALELILDKYAPDDKVVGMAYAEKSFSRTRILCLNINCISGKCRR